MIPKYFGKYRGLVVGNLDPLQVGRIMATVPDVLGEVPTGWAMPCVPCGLPDKPGLAIPAMGAQVWIEFEQGNLDHPIWSGCFWGSAAETPPALRNPR
jgi:hypothetical protein